MVSVEEALELVDSTVFSGAVKKVSTIKSLGYVLANDVCSKINMPPFNQSAMDGFGIHFSDNDTKYNLVGEIPAGGKYKHFDLQKGEAVRIYTGAPVPKGVDVVVMQEVAIRENEVVSFSGELKLGGNIRLAGEQIKEGAIALKEGVEITPGAIGFLLSVGVTDVEVYKKPDITIIVTGDELTKPGEELDEGKIYESNSFMLSGAVSEAGFPNHKLTAIKDTYEETKSTISEALSESDVVILSGGISVGDYDFVGEALIELGVEEVFYKVKQKPGKPLFFGKIGKKYVFALPGNPAASLTSYYIYVARALNRITGINNKGLNTTLCTLSKDYIKKGTRAQFLKAFVDTSNVVTVMDGQSSAMLHAFSIANAIIYIPLDKELVKQGEQVITYLLP